MSDATYLRGTNEIRITAAAAMDPGQIMQLADGRAGVLQATAGAALGDRVSPTPSGQFTMIKKTGICLLDGGRAYWNYAGNFVTFKKAGDRDFYLGRVVGDAASADTTCVVNLNVDPRADIDLLAGEGGVLSVATGTQALGGFLPPQVFGKSRALTLTATAEVQSVDMLSVDRVAKNAKPIAEFVARVSANGSTNAVKLNLGLASGTSTTDASAVSEYVFLRVDGGALAINAQSKDGTTTVGVTDTTKVITVGSAIANRSEFWIDGRDPTNVKLYVDGVRVLPGTVFRIDGSANQFGLLAHLAKTTGTATAGPVYIDRAELRISE